MQIIQGLGAKKQAPWNESEFASTTGHLQSTLENNCLFKSDVAVVSWLEADTGEKKCNHNNQKGKAVGDINSPPNETQHEGWWIAQSRNGQCNGVNTNIIVIQMIIIFEFLIKPGLKTTLREGYIQFQISENNGRK